MIKLLVRLKHILYGNSALLQPTEYQRITPPHKVPDNQAFTNVIRYFNNFSP